MEAMVSIPLSSPKELASWDRTSLAAAQLKPSLSPDRHADLSFMLASSYDNKNPILHHCLLYIRFLANSFKNVRSVKNYISGARTFINMIGGNPALFSSPMTFTLLKGLANQSHHVEQEAPALPRSTFLPISEPWALMAW